jgi:transitional endoplasmic reticulum ATPase
MDDVAGLEEVKAAIRKRVIYPFQHPEVTRKYRKQAGGGVLLYGPPGTGKTMIAKAIASEVDATFFSVKCSDVMSKWVGQAERNVSRLFEAARGRERAVVFLDETEAIVAKRGGDSTVMNRVIPEFLAQVDGLEGRPGGPLLLGATNRPWDMDDAALRPGRFGELIYVPLPDVVARRQIVAAALKGILLAEQIDVGAIAAQAEGYSGADSVALCEAAKDGPYEREIDSGLPQRLEVADLADAFRRVRPSVSPAQLRRYEKFQQTRE